MTSDTPQDHTPPELKAVLGEALAATKPTPPLPLEEQIAGLLREHIKVDAAGLAPAVVSHHITGFDEAARALSALFPKGGSGEAEGLSREEAESRIAALRRDHAWQARWMAGGEPERALWKQLTAIASGEALAAHPAPKDIGSEPIPMVLFCPACGVQHIDEPELPYIGDRIIETGDEEAAERIRAETWNNPPHRSHLCLACGHIWRPADVPTTGVQAVQTKGKADSPLAFPKDRGEGVALSDYAPDLKIVADTMREMHSELEKALNGRLSLYDPAAAIARDIAREAASPSPRDKAGEGQ